MTHSTQCSRRHFMTAAAIAAGSALAPRFSFANPQDPVINTFEKDGKPVGHEKVDWKVRPFPLKQVRLGNGPCKVAMEADRRYLHSLPTDRLLHAFRVNAGIASSAQPLGGWEAPDCELRGHYTGGHYLSACALMYATTGDDDLKKNANIVVGELAKCQEALQSGGYLSAFPVTFFDRLRNRQPVWAPFYTIHKIMAGNLDMYVHCGNEQALAVTERMAGWASGFMRPLSYDHAQRVLNTEFGGMGEVLCNLYAVTGKEQYLEAAQRFDKELFFDPLAGHRDELKGLHANTHIPQVIAAARYYELTGDNRYRQIAEYFWDEVVSERCFATGGPSIGRGGPMNEGWDTDPGKLGAGLASSTEECCCAYNMMKLTRHLFGWAPDARKMDYYERVLFNHRLGTINPEDGTMMYYLEPASGAWRTYGGPFDAFWCCTGTGSEEYAKLTDTIYFHDDDSLYVNLFLDSQLEWPEKGLQLSQRTRFPEEEGTTLTVSVKNPLQLGINLRIPHWASGGSVRINGALVPAFSNPGSYLTLNRVWKSGDKIELSLPMSLHIESMPDDPTIQAVMYGPLLLAGRFDPVSKEMLYGDYEPKPGDFKMVNIVADPRKPTAWLERDPKQPCAFRSLGQSQALTLVPLYQVIRERYAFYWKVSNSPA
jgi:DUF1680 family protein